MPTLRLFSRHACHLCDEMLAELQPLRHELGFNIEIEDVDSRPDWQRRYGTRVPVLESPDGLSLCEYHLDEPAVREWLQSARGKSVC